jgi:hypothetical protein
MLLSPILPRTANVRLQYFLYFLLFNFDLFLKNPELGQMTGFPPPPSSVQAPLDSLPVFLIEKYVIQ